MWRPNFNFFAYKQRFLREGRTFPSRRKLRLLVVSIAKPNVNEAHQALQVTWREQRHLLNLPEII